MRTALLIVFSFLLVSCDSSQTFYDKAIKLGDQGKYSDAIALLDKAIESQPDFLDAFIQRGYYQMCLDKYPLAVMDFENALRLDRNNTLALYNLASCKYSLGEYGEAIKCYNKSLDTKGGQAITLDLTNNPNFDNPKAVYDVPTVEIIYGRANSYREMDSLQKAYFDYQHCINNNYMVANSYYRIAYLYFASGKNNPGCDALNKAIQLGYKDVEPEYLKRCQTN